MELTSFYFLEKRWQEFLWFVWFPLKISWALWSDHKHVLWLNVDSCILLMPAHLSEVRTPFQLWESVKEENLRMHFMAYQRAFWGFLEINDMSCSGTENEWWQGERKAWEWVWQKNRLLGNSQQNWNLSMAFAEQDLYFDGTSMGLVEVLSISLSFEMVIVLNWLSGKLPLLNSSWSICRDSLSGFRGSSHLTKLLS